VVLRRTLGTALKTVWDGERSSDLVKSTTFGPYFHSGPCPKTRSAKALPAYRTKKEAGMKTSRVFVSVYPPETGSVTWRSLADLGFLNAVTGEGKALYRMKKAAGQ